MADSGGSTNPSPFSVFALVSAFWSFLPAMMKRGPGQWACLKTARAPQRPVVAERFSRSLHAPSYRGATADHASQTWTDTLDTRRGALLCVTARAWFCARCARTLCRSSSTGTASF